MSNARDFTYWIRNDWQILTGHLEGLPGQTNENTHERSYEIRNIIIHPGYEVNADDHLWPYLLYVMDFSNAPFDNIPDYFTDMVNTEDGSAFDPGFKIMPSLSC